MPPLERLRDVLRKPDAVVFVGAGLSAWSGLPSWSELLLELANFRDALGLGSDLVRREIERADLLQAASYGLMDVTPSQRRDFIIGACRPDVAAPSEAHLALLELPPTCFVTTNYDTLLEQALAQERPRAFYQVITNRQPVDQPTILRATSTQFVFKPHGQAADIDSVIITREDYRRLASEWSYTLQSLRTLLVTRPVVFVGYGLRDPDFLMVRDAIAADYGGGAQDHYALVLNPHVDEVRYWRDSYGVHLVGYPEGAPNGANRHSGLLELLASMRIGQTKMESDAPVAPGVNETLALIRLAARNQRLTDSLDDSNTIPLRLSFSTGPQTSSYPRAHYFHGHLYSDALAHLEGTVYVYGPPGAGKTFGALRHIRHLAAELSAKCMASETQWADLVVPLFISLRLYDGDLSDLLRQQMPAGLGIETLSRSRTFIVLDGINEVPQKHLDDGSFLADITESLAHAPFSTGTVLILGRALHEAPWPEVLTLELDQIDSAWLIEQYPQVRSAEMLRSLSRPIIYRMVRDGIVPLSEVEKPADIYRLYFERLLQRISAPLMAGCLDALGAMAFETVNEGAQAVLFSRVVTRLGRRHKDPAALAAKLVELEFLQPVTDARVTFPHHSFLEYLAALELLRREIATPGTVTQVSVRRSWDYVTLFAASLSTGEVRKGIIQQLLRVDMSVAIRALLFSGQVEGAVIAEVLDALPQMWPDGLTGLHLAKLVARIPVSAEHAPVLGRLIANSGLLGSIGASLLMKLDAEAGAPPLIDILVAQADDFNVCGEIGRMLAPHMNPRLMMELIARIEEVGENVPIDWSATEDISSPASNLAWAAGEAMKFMSPDEVLSLLNPSEVEGVRLRFLRHWLADNRGHEAFQALMVLIRRGKRAAVFPFYLQLMGPGQLNPSLPPVSSAVVTTLVGFAGGDTPDRWSAGALLLLGQKAPPVRALIAGHIGSAKGMLRLVLTIASAGWNNAEHAAAIEAAVEGLIGQDEAEWELVDALDLEWSQYPGLVEKILLSKDMRAIRSVGSDLQGQDLPPIDLCDVECWLLQLTSVSLVDASAAFYLGRILARVATPADELRIVKSIDVLEEAARLAVVRFLLPGFSRISTDDLSTATISLLLKLEIRSDRCDWSYSSALATLATERFVERSLIPLISGDAPEWRRRTVAALLDVVGRRHGRRYVGSDGEVLG